MELELVIGTIRKGIKSTIKMHILIFVSAFRKKLKIISYFQLFLHNFFTFYPKNPKRPNRQSANMAHFVAFCIGFQKNIPLQNPPGGGGYMAAQGLYRLHHNSGVAVITPTDRPKSVGNSCVIEVFGAWRVLCCHFAFLIFL